MSGWRIVDARSIVGRRSLRDLHDLKLAANDRGSGGLTLSLFIRYNIDTKVFLEKSLFSYGVSIFSLFSSNANSPFSGKSKQVPASPTFLPILRDQRRSFCRTSLHEEWRWGGGRERDRQTERETDRERDRKRIQDGWGGVFRFHPLERRFLACVYRS